MLRVLLQKANDANLTVAANVLMCLGELTCVGGEGAMQLVPELMQVFISRLSGPSLIKRDTTLHALGQVCSSAGYVIQPLIDYPQLLPLLGRILRTENNLCAGRWSRFWVSWARWTPTDERCLKFLHFSSLSHSYFRIDPMKILQARLQ